MADNETRSGSYRHDNSNQKTTFNPMLYNFRVSPQTGSSKTFALQQPFATLFDNLITVLWSVYGKGTKIQIGVNQLQWALEFMRCMKVDYGYPESIGKIVNELENQLITLYAKVGKKIQERNKQKEEEELNKNDVPEKASKSSELDKSPTNFTSYNEEDIMKKLENIKVPSDPITGEAKYLKELNSLGKRKSKNKDNCDENNKSSKTYMIGALQKILSKTSDAETKTGVEELIKELKVENPSPKKTT